MTDSFNHLSGAYVKVSTPAPYVALVELARYVALGHTTYAKVTVPSTDDHDYRNPVNAFHEPSVQPWMGISV